MSAMRAMSRGAPAASGTKMPNRPPAMVSSVARDRDNRTGGAQHDRAERGDREPLRPAADEDAQRASDHEVQGCVGEFQRPELGELVTNDDLAVQSAQGDHGERDERCAGEAGESDRQQCRLGPQSGRRRLGGVGVLRAVALLSGRGQKGGEERRCEGDPDEPVGEFDDSRACVCRAKTMASKME